MTTLTIRAPTIEEEGAEDFEPFPRIALARNNVTLVPFVLALPMGDGNFLARFDITEQLVISQGAVRYSEMFPPVYLPFPWQAQPVYPGDQVAVTLVRGGR
jgi:hypothetical protein